MAFSKLWKKMTCKLLEQCNLNYTKESNKFVHWTILISPKLSVYEW